MPPDISADQASAPTRARSGFRIPGNFAAPLLLAPAYVWIGVAVLLPLLTMLVFSFLNAAPMGRAPVHFSFKQYQTLASQTYLLGIAWRSLSLGIWTTLLCAVLGFLGALALARSTTGRVRETLLVLILLPFWTNALVRTFSWTMILREHGFLDHLLQSLVDGNGSYAFLYTQSAVIVGLVHGYLPYSILTCYIALVSIDGKIVEAASSLGARWWTILFRIYIPLAMPGIVTGAVLTFVPVISAFMEPRILGGRTGVTLGTVIEDQFTQAFNWPLGAALSFTMLAVVIAILGASYGALRRGLGASL